MTIVSSAFPTWLGRCCFLWLALIFFSGFSARGQDWPKWRGPGGDGIASEVLPAEFDPETVLWRGQVGVGYASVAIADGRLFTLGHDGKETGGQETLWCLDAKTGAVLWKHSWDAPLLPNLHEGGPAATPLVADGNVFVVGKNGDAWCCRADTGAVRWHLDLLAETGRDAPPEWGFAGSPVLHGELLLLEAGVTLGVDSKNGEVVWRSQPFRPAYGSPALFESGDETRIAVLKTDGLVILDPGNGGTLAFTPWETSFDTNATTPIAKGAALFVSTGYDRGCALFEFDGRQLAKRYENLSLSTHMNNAVLLEGYLYGFDGTAHRGRPTEFVCLEFESGRERWRVPPTESLGCGSLIATRDGHLLILTERGELVLAKASPSGFEVEKRGQILGGRCWTPPALADGVLYARNARGDVVAVGRD